MIAYKLEQQIKEIKNNPKAKEVNKLNLMILGMQNYYSMATDINLYFNEIAFTVNRALENRLRAHFLKEAINLKFIKNIIVNTTIELRFI
ncbi:hypothetical protein MWH25_09925 [Natroniella acetigena]|nr:hypothetical protein [Natroniella acetigena]